jgi:hypothetical protein
MPRKPGTSKRALKGLSHREKRRRLLYGDFESIAGILDSVRLAQFASGEIREKALQFLGDWVCRAESREIGLLARWKRSPDHLRQPVDWLNHLLVFGMRNAQIGQTPNDVLRNTPTHQLVTELKAMGWNVDATTVRKGLQTFGIKKAPGRPKKNREIPE